MAGLSAWSPHTSNPSPPLHRFAGYGQAPVEERSGPCFLPPARLPPVQVHRGKPSASCRMFLWRALAKRTSAGQGRPITGQKACGFSAHIHLSGTTHTPSASCRLLLWRAALARHRTGRAEAWRTSSKRPVVLATRARPSTPPPRLSATSARLIGPAQAQGRTARDRRSPRHEHTAGRGRRRQPVRCNNDIFLKYLAPRVRAAHHLVRP